MVDKKEEKKKKKKEQLEAIKKVKAKIKKIEKSKMLDAKEDAKEIEKEVSPSELVIADLAGEELEIVMMLNVGEVYTTQKEIIKQEKRIETIKKTLIKQYGEGDHKIGRFTVSIKLNVEEIEFIIGKAIKIIPKHILKDCTKKKIVNKVEVKL